MRRLIRLFPIHCGGKLTSLFWSSRNHTYCFKQTTQPKGIVIVGDDKLPYNNMMAEKMLRRLARTRSSVQRLANSCNCFCYVHQSDR